MQHFVALLKKNLKTEQRVWLRSLIELLIVLVCFTIICINPVERHEYDKWHKLQEHDTQFLDIQEINSLKTFESLLNGPQIKKMRLAYTPNLGYAKDITKKVARNLGLKGVIAYETEYLMVSQFNAKNTLAAIVYQTEEDVVPSNFSVTIRFPSKFRTISSYESHEELWATRCGDGEELSESSQDLYSREGFLQLQHGIFMEWIKLNENITVYPNQNITVIPFFLKNAPYCSYKTASNYILFLHYFAFLYTFINLIWRYGREHEANIFVHHWKYGFRYLTHWFAHFLVSFLHLLILFLIVILLLKVNWFSDEFGGGLVQIDFSYLLIFLLMYGISMIVFAIFIVSLVTNAKNAVLVGVICWVSAYSFFSIVLERIDSADSLAVEASLLLFFNNTFGLGMKFMKQLDHISISNNEFVLVSIAQIINILIYLLLIIIVQILKPGLYMSPTYDYCGFGKCAKKMKRKKKKSKVKIVTLAGPTPSWHNYEFGPMGAQEYIKLKNVCTYYKNDSGVQLLKNVSMRMFKGEITVILGYHGSGKTTLMKVLSGLCKPNAGQVKYLDEDIYENPKKARELYDFCMSTTPLFDYLTIGETLHYFAKLKMPKTDARQIDAEVQKYLEMLKPTRMTSKQVINKLESDHKRLVHLCCLLAGGTKIILLDEPTIHMRLMERKFYWNILNREKQNRTIVLTTFSTDEAEIAADRIAIINEGVVKAQGTQFFLKTKFGTYFNLVCIVKPQASSDKITKFIKVYLPGVVLDNELGDQLIYKLPIDKRYVYENMLVHLVLQKATLHIVDVRVFSCTISEVYTKLGEQKNNQVINKNDSNYNVIYDIPRKITKQQIHAMFYKKLVYQAPTLIPLVMVLVSVCLILIINPMSEVLKTPFTRDYAIKLGFNTPDTDMSLIDQIYNCSNVLITSIQRNKKIGRNNIEDRVFDYKSLKCSNQTFKDYIESTSVLDSEILGASEVTNDNITVYFNIRVFHAAAYSLNLGHNMYINHVNYSYPIENYYRVTNKPLPISLKTRVGLMDQAMAHMRVPLTVGLVMPLAIAAFILPIVEERCKNVLILQVIAGLQMKIYWGVTFLWDMGTFFAYNIIFIIVMAFTTFEGFNFFHKILTFLLLNIYGFGALFTIYLISLFDFKTAYRAFLVAILVQILTGICTYVFYWDVLQNNHTFFYFASIFPTFSLLDGISNIYITAKEVEFCNLRCEASKGCDSDNMCKIIPQCCSLSFMQMGHEGILQSVVFMISAGIIIIILMICLQVHDQERKYATTKNLKHYNSACFAYDDKTVIELKKHISNLDLRDILRYRIFVDQLENKFTKKHHSLHTVSFACERGNSLCIFGHRHSGKSNLIKQLIGEKGYKFGEVYIEGFELKHDLSKAYKQMSYVPKNYGHFELFSPRETLRFYLMIRGIVKENIPKIIRQYGAMLDMNKFMDRKIMYLSPEKRRKVNIALALAQNTTVIIIDEPTAGLPAHTCREIWNALRYEQFVGRTILFTSASCMEVKNIGDKLILYQDNDMLAYGSIYSVCALFTIGFFLELKLLRDGASAELAEANLTKDIENLHRFIIFLHENSELRVRIDTWLKYYCPVVNIKFTTLFGALEHHKTRLNIMDYTVNEGSLWDALYNISNARHKHKTNR